MSDRPRRFWQIHLSTAMILMLAAASLLYLNLNPQVHGFGPWYGWPAIAYRGDFAEAAFLENAFGRKITGIDSAGLLTNVTVCLGLLGVTAVLCELIIRRRSKP